MIKTRTLEKHNPFLGLNQSDLGRMTTRVPVSMNLPYTEHYVSGQGLCLLTRRKSKTKLLGTSNMCHYVYFITTWKSHMYITIHLLVTSRIFRLVKITYTILISIDFCNVHKLLDITYCFAYHNCKTLLCILIAHEDIFIYI